MFCRKPQNLQLCHRTVYALDLTKGGDVLRIKEKGGCWLNNPFGRSDRFEGKEDNPSPTHPTYEKMSNEVGGGGEERNRRA